MIQTIMSRLGPEFRIHVALAGLASLGVVLSGCANRDSIQPTTLAPAGTATPDTVRLPTAVVIRETPTPIPFEITELQFQDIVPGKEVGVIFCTKGRPVGTTLRVRRSISTVNPNITQAELKADVSAGVISTEVIKELGVPCFNTNPANPDWPIWSIGNLTPGDYSVIAEARPDEAHGDWNSPTVVSRIASYTVK